MGNSISTIDIHHGGQRSHAVSRIQISISIQIMIGSPRSFRESLFSEFQDRKSTRLNSSHVAISYAVFCLKKKKTTKKNQHNTKNIRHKNEKNVDIKYH